MTDIVSSLYVQGFRKLLIINGHGGNSFKSTIRDLAVDYPDFLIARSEWHAVESPKFYFDTPGDHTDEVETSVMMHHHPELVKLPLLLFPLPTNIFLFFEKIRFSLTRL